jgi:hypothetical protein
VHADSSVRRYAWEQYAKLLADMGSSHLSLIYLSLFATNYLKV